RAGPVRYSAGDFAYHLGGARRVGADLLRDRSFVLALAHPRAEPVSLCGDPASDADRRNRAVDHHLGTGAVSGALGLRVDRRVFPDRVEHDGGTQQRRPQSIGAVPAVRRLARPNLAVPATADRPALLSRWAA